MTILNMHTFAIRLATKALYESQQNASQPVQILVLSKDSELRGKWYKLRDEFIDRNLDLPQQPVEVIHLNYDQLTSVIARGATRSALVISRRLWGARISAPRWQELSNSLTTCAHVNQCEVSDLIYYI